MVISDSHPPVPARIGMGVEFFRYLWSIHMKWAWMRPLCRLGEVVHKVRWTQPVRGNSSGFNWSTRGLFHVEMGDCEDDWVRLAQALSAGKPGQEQYVSK